MEGPLQLESLVQVQLGTVKIVIRACTDPVGDPLQETETETETSCLKPAVSNYIFSFVELSSWKVELVARLSVFDIDERITLWFRYISSTCRLRCVVWLWVKQTNTLIYLKSVVLDDGCFCSDYVNEIKESSRNMFSDMCKMCVNLTPDVILEPSISMAQLCGFVQLFIFCINARFFYCLTQPEKGSMTTECCRGAVLMHWNQGNKLLSRSVNDEEDMSRNNAVLVVVGGQRISHI